MALLAVALRILFNAHGLYSGDHFFGILDEGRLLFKTDARSQLDYTSRGMSPIAYESKDRMATMNFYEVPPDVLEQPQELVEWAR